MQAKDVMTTAVITAAPDTEVGEIAKTQTGNRISAVPVVDADRRVLGIVSEGDLVRRAETGTEKERGSWWLTLFTLPEDLAKEYSKSHGRRAEDVMTRNVVTVEEDTPIAEIARLLEKNHVKRVPVVRDGRLVGIVSRANLLHGLAAARTAEAAPVSAGDSEIRNAVMGMLHQQPWVRQAYVNATVEGGVVHLWGVADSQDQIQAVEVAAREIGGVKTVENHMSVMGRHLYYGE